VTDWTYLFVGPCPELLQYSLVRLQLLFILSNLPVQVGATVGTVCVCVYVCVCVCVCGWVGGCECHVYHSIEELGVMATTELEHCLLFLP